MSTLKSNTVTALTTNGDLTITGNGTGKINLTGAAVAAIVSLALPLHLYPLLLLCPQIFSELPVLLLKLIILLGESFHLRSQLLLLEFTISLHLG